MEIEYILTGCFLVICIGIAFCREAKAKELEADIGYKDRIIENYTETIRIQRETLDCKSRTIEVLQSLCKAKNMEGK